MIFAWLTGRFLGLSRGLWLLGVVLALFGLWMALTRAENADDRNNQQLGRDQERAGQLAETLDRVEQADETRDQVDRDLGAGGSRELYEQCLRTARTPALCKRFLPKCEGDDSRAGADAGCQ